MDNVLMFFFGSVRRALSTCLVILAIFGILNPEAANEAVATAWNNFWTAFGPVLGALLKLFVVGGVIVMVMKSWWNKVFGSSGNKKKSD